MVVGTSGSSKTFAMKAIQNNLSSCAKNKKLTNMHINDYFVVSFQYSKLTTESIEKRWNYGVSVKKIFKEQQTERNANRQMSARAADDPTVATSDEFDENHQEQQDQVEHQIQQKKHNVVMFLDEVGLAEHSSFRPLKILHKLFEHQAISFVGLASHHAIYGNRNKNIHIRDINISDFKTHGTRLSGFENIILSDIKIYDSSQIAYFKGEYSHGCMLLQRLKTLAETVNMQDFISQTY